MPCHSHGRYVVSSEAARQFVAMIDQYGFIGPVDLMLATMLDRIEGCYTTYPLMLHVPLGRDGKFSDDTDVQDEVRVTGAP